MVRARTLAAAGGIFAAAYLLRFAYLLQIARSPFFDLLQLDPLYYHDWAKRIAGGDWLGTEVFEMSPLYSYLLALFLMVFGHDLWLLRLAQIGVGAVTCVLTYALGCRLFDRRAGLLAGLGCAAYGPFFFYEGQVMKEFLTPPLATAALLLVLRASIQAGAPRDIRLPRSTVRPFAAAGALLGLAALVRDNFLLLIALLTLWALYETHGRVAAALPFLAGAFAVLLPVAARNWWVGGDLVLTTSGGGEVFYIGNGPYANGAYVPPPWVRSNPRFEHEDFRAKARELTGRDLSRAEASRFWWKQGARWILEHPGRSALLWMRKLALFWNDHELPDNYSFYTFRRFSSILTLLLTFGPVAALAWAGVVFSAGDWRRLIPVYLMGAGYMVSVLVFFNFARFRLPMVPILLVFAGRGLTGLHDAARSWRSRPSARGKAIAAALVCVLAVPMMYIDWSSAAEEPFQDRLHLAAAYRQAGQSPEAEQVLRLTIRDAETLVKRHGGEAARGSTTPGGITFVLALSAAHRDLGGALMDQKRYLEAADAYKRAAALSENDASIMISLASALKAGGRPSEAERAYRRALARDPSSFIAHFDLATLMYEAGRLEEALAELELGRTSAKNLSPLDRADYHYGAGAILYAIPGREQEAARHFEEGLKLNPEAPAAPGAREALEKMGLGRR